MKEKNHHKSNLYSEEEHKKIVHELHVHQIELEMQNEELRRIQAELEKSRDKYTDLYDFSPVGYITINRKNIIEEANLTASNMLGTVRASLMGKPITSFINREDQDIFYKLKKFVLETGKQDSSYIRLSGRENSFFYGRLEMMPVRPGEGGYSGLRIAISDITGIKAAEEEAAKAANELRNRMTAHNNQLRGLALELSNAEQRERKRIAAVLHDNLQQLLVGIKLNIQSSFGVGGEKISENLRRIAVLVDDSIRVSKSLVLELSPPVLHEGGLVPAVNWLGMWMKEKFGLTVDLRADTDIKPDSGGLYVQLFEFIRELLLNVVKHGHTGTAAVFIGHKNGRIQIAVSDEGAGFKYEELRGHAESGYGLFSIRERLALLGGEMTVESAPGRGTRVTIQAPMTQAAASAEKQAGKPASHMIAAASERENSGGQISYRTRVLVVDDHKIVREGLSMLLSSVPDIEVVGEAFDGAEAIALTRKIHPDIVIMDINMPGMNGIEATRIITRESPDIIIIGLSMLEEADRSKDLLEAGAADYIHKAAAFEELIASVRSHARQLKEISADYGEN